MPSSLPCYPLARRERGWGEGYGEACLNIRLKRVAKKINRGASTPRFRFAGLGFASAGDGLHRRLCLGQQVFQHRPGSLFHFSMQAMPMGIHGDHHGEVLDFNYPHGFRHTKLQLVYP